MNIRRAIKWGAWIILAVALGLYGSVLYGMRELGPIRLLACMEVESPWLSWTCEQILKRDSLTSDEVAELNQSGGAKFPAMMKDPRAAEELLSRFVAQGVDVNAGDNRSMGWTALHGMVVDGNADRVSLLLRHGARVDIRGQSGLTPLDLARQMQQKYPGDVVRAEIVKTLEAAGNRN
jgi:hypothetical protein